MPGDINRDLPGGFYPRRWRIPRWRWLPRRACLCHRWTHDDGGDDDDDGGGDDDDDDGDDDDDDGGYDEVHNRKCPFVITQRTLYARASFV